VNLRQAINGPHVTSQKFDDVGPIIVVTPCYYISASMLRIQARKRQNGVPDYMRGKPAQ